MLLKATRADAAYNLRLDGRNYNFEALDISHRWDFKADLDAAFTLSATQTLNIGTSYRRDFLLRQQADNYHSFIDYSHAGELVRLRLWGNSTVEKSLRDADAVYEFNTGGEYGDAESNHFDQTFRATRPSTTRAPTAG